MRTPTLSLFPLFVAGALAPAPLLAQSLLYERYGPGPQSALGHSVAGGVDFDHDGHGDVVVGNPFDDGNGLINNGSVRIVSGADGSILHTGWGPTDGALFGWSVAIAGDADGDGFLDIVAGAPQAETGGIRPGMAQVFSYETMTVLHTVWGTGDQNELGFSVDGRGLDVDADGFGDFVVGSPGEGLGGAARVHSGATGTILAGYTESLSAGVRTGATVASLGDVDGSGFADWGLGAPSFDGGDGRVLIFEGQAPYPYYWSRYGSSGSRFGSALEGHLDLDGDGLGDYLVGAITADGADPDVGSVSVFEGIDLSPWAVWYGEETGERFGAAIARLPDLSGDGSREVVVGAPRAGGDDGRAYVLAAIDGSELFRVEGSPGSRLGTSVARAGDFNDDGGYDLVVSGPRADDPQNPAVQGVGVMRVYSGEGPGLVRYCTAGTSANGCEAFLSATGTPSASSTNGFFVSAYAVEGKRNGMFFYGANGRQATPWGNGTSFQCVVPPVKRGGLLPSNGTNGACDGWFLQDLNARWCASCPKPAHNPGAGAVSQVQLWYRDPASTSNQTTSLSDALEFVVQP